MSCVTDYWLKTLFHMKQEQLMCVSVRTCRDSHVYREINKFLLLIFICSLSLGDKNVNNHYLLS